MQPIVRDYQRYDIQCKLICGIMSLDRPKLQHESIEDGEMFEARKAFTQSDDDGVAMLIIIIRVILRKKVMTGIFYGIVILQYLLCVD